MKKASLALALLGIVVGIFALFGAEMNFEICMGSILMVAIALLMWVVGGRRHGD